MSSKRSYLDAVNAGRQRRSYASLEQLNRSLESLEQRLERNRDEVPDRRREPLRPAHASVDDRAADLGQQQPYRSIARDIERMRRDEDGFAAFGKIAGELKGLREELRNQMASSVRREFDDLRKDFHHANTQGGRAASKLGDDVERLSSAVQALGERADDRGINKLRLELEQMKGVLDSLAREETVLSIDRRWDAFDRRFDDFEHRVSSRTDLPGSKEIAALTERVEQIGRAVGSLPESLSLRALEDKVRTLAGALDQFIAHHDGRATQTFGHIEERLDEISRAIVSATIAAQKHLDLEPFEKIEGRIAALARQIEEVVEDAPERDVMEHIRGLSQRVDELAAHGTMRNVDEIVSGIEQRFDGLSSMFEQRQEDALERGNMLFRELERRFEEVAQRLDQRQGAGALDGTADAVIRNLEDRLDGISRRLEESAIQFGGIDPDLVRNLEAQVAGLSEHLSRPSAPLPEFVDISPRLREIEKSIAENRESVLEAARAAAETAARSLAAANQPDASAVAGLSDEVKALEALTRLSDERNSKTFEAIHDTLLKIVDRMGALERESGRAPERKLEVSAPPSIDAGDILPVDAEDDVEQRSPQTWTAADPASEPAPEADPNAAGMNSMLGRLTRAFSKKSEAVEPAFAASPAAPAISERSAPEIDLDAPLDPVIANQPLEPGSGAPDLHAIMKRVRDERAPAGRASETDAGKSDFIAAARRAAQAAAAEAEARKRKPETAPGRVLRIGDLLKSRRKYMLLGATALMTALAGLQYGKALMGEEPARTSSVRQQTVVAAEAAEQRASAPSKATAAARAPDASSATAAGQLAKLAEAKPAMVSAFAEEPAAPAQSRFASASAGDVTIEIIPADQASGAAQDAAILHLSVPSEIGAVALREAAESGDPKAFHAIADRYAEGQGVRKDMAEAARWYEESAELGFGPAQYRIGNMYEKGVGVERDLQKARDWYLQAAESGNANAMHNLAVLYAMGADGRTDNGAAAKWFLNAAELGVKDSQFNMGILSAKGIGVEQSLEQSYKWFAIVARTGDADATAKRDEIAKALRPEQLEKARAAAELWKPKPLDPTANAVDIPDAWQDKSERTASLDEAAVQTVQQLLNRKGYDAGSADGVVGGKTKAAIARFQKDNGLEATGRVDENLVRTLAALN
jgi:localization factor PodJL